MKRRPKKSAAVGAGESAGSNHCPARQLNPNRPQGTRLARGVPAFSEDANLGLEVNHTRSPAMANECEKSKRVRRIAGGNRNTKIFVGDLVLAQVHVSVPGNEFHLDKLFRVFEIGILLPQTFGRVWGAV